MNDEQLMNLIDLLFESENETGSLWGEVMMEAARRNLSRIRKKEFHANTYCQIEPENLYIEKLPVLCLDIDEDDHDLPASDLYTDWEDLDEKIFIDECRADTAYDLTLEGAGHGCFHMPAWGPLSSPFGWRKNRWHKGVDIQLRKGDPIRAAFDGVVRYARKKGGYGNVVIVRHYNGLETVYGHLYRIEIEEGTRVAAGDLIGLAGNTGKSTGPHLHFEVRFMGAPINPEYLIDFDYGRTEYNTIVLKKSRRTGFISAWSPAKEFHIVSRGESFVKIATQYFTSTAKLRELNGMSPRQYVRIKRGMVLRVREPQGIDDSESASAR